MANIPLAGYGHFAKYAEFVRASVVVILEFTIKVQHTPTPSTPQCSTNFAARTNVALCHKTYYTFTNKRVCRMGADIMLDTVLTDRSAIAAR